MSYSIRTRAVALVAATVLASWSATLPAHADPKDKDKDSGGQSSTAPGQDKDKDKPSKDKPSKDKPSKPAKPTKPSKDKPVKDKPAKPAKPPKDKPAKPAKDKPVKDKPAKPAKPPKDKQVKPGKPDKPVKDKPGKGDPAGNNGTIKIAGPGDLDGTPDNNPHPGCTFFIEWYGFDEGPDVVSTVSFAMHAPTSDATYTVLEGDTTKFVGGDPASGAGTATGKDGEERYVLAFAGEPHPKQGYHVKVTVATPRSQGNDTKSKVFWVAPCEGVDETIPDDGGETGEGEETDEETGEGEASEDEETDRGVLGTSAQAPGVAGAAGTAPGAAPAANGAEAEAAAEDDSAAVPTAVDAGGNGVLPEWAQSSTGIVLMVLGAGLLGLGGALLLWRRRRVATDV